MRTSKQAYDRTEQYMVSLTAEVSKVSEEKVAAAFQDVSNKMAQAQQDMVVLKDFQTQAHLQIQGLADGTAKALKDAETALRT